MNIEQLGNDLDRFTFEYLMEQSLSRVSPDVDTRQGSIIYDTLAVANYELAMKYMELKNILHAIFIQSTWGEYLDLRAAEQGLSRQSATQAIRLGQFTDSGGEPMDVPVGSIFSTIAPTGGLHYTVIEQIEKGSYQLECTEDGIVGNDYVGDLLPISNLNGLGSAVMSTLLVPGQNEETDDSLRGRFFAIVNERAFGGNVTQYKREVLEIDGVGAVQIYPVWNGGGTVKVSILSPEYDMVSQDFINSVQNILDPRIEGLGLGIAPIGHQVTVGTATQRHIDVTLHLDFLQGNTTNQMRGVVVEAIEKYFNTLRRNWSSSDDLNRYAVTVFRSQIMAAVLAVEGVTNVSEVLFDALAVDVVLVQTGELQELPMLGEVVINAN